MVRAKVAREQPRELYMERNRVKVGTGKQGRVIGLKEKYFR